MPRVHYFKYRSLSNLRYFLDILVNKRLYMASYRELNDPIEGAYVANLDGPEVDLNTLRILRGDKDQWRICSLSKKHDNILMWAHYADSNKGCCIECSVIPAQGADKVNVSYVPEVLPIGYYDPDKTAKELLSRKLECWSYEDEVRFMKRAPDTREGNIYLKIKIHKIYLGVDVSNKDKDFYRQLILSINKKIEVIEMERDNLTY